MGPGDLQDVLGGLKQHTHADLLVGLTHVKGHEMTGIGGTLKNFGMGAAKT